MGAWERQGPQDQVDRGGFGGASWGSATDGKLVYVNIINDLRNNFTLAPSTEVTNGGGWVGINAATGRSTAVLKQAAGLSS